MTLVRLVFPTVMVLLFGTPWSVDAFDSTRVCGLLTPQELKAVGITLTTQGLMPTDPVFVKKGEAPGVTTDIRVDSCSNEMAVEYAAFPVSWSVVTAKDRIDKKAWDNMAEALDDQEKKGTDPSAQQFVIDGVDCETMSWPEKAGKRIYAVSCTGHKEFSHVTLEFAHRERTKLLAAKSVKQLLDKMLARL